jgi:hypothetical protein
VDARGRRAAQSDGLVAADKAHKDGSLSAHVLPLESGEKVLATNLVDDALRQSWGSN